jgi:hypothetical protein
MLDNDKHIYTIILDEESKAEALSLITDLIQHGYMGKGVNVQIHNNLLNISVNVSNN